MKTIYTDMCLPTMKQEIKQKFLVDVHIRDEKLWNLNYVMQHILHSDLDIIVINQINHMSICEITMGAFTNKKILVTDNNIKTSKVMELITDIDPTCTLTLNNNNFLAWYGYHIGANK